MTQHEKILYTMLRHPEKEWFYAPDFMKTELGDFFVGYEASPRMSELVGMYKNIIKTKKIGKYRYLAIDWNYIKECVEKGTLGVELDDTARTLAEKNYRFGMPYQAALI